MLSIGLDLGERDIGGSERAVDAARLECEPRLIDLCDVGAAALVV